LLGAAPRFNKTVVLRYRIHLEARKLAPGTINLRLGAVRRLAYEASDCGLLSPDQAAGIRRVKGVKNLGLAGEADSPGFLAVHPNHRFLYATNEIGDMKAQNGGALAAFSIDQTTGMLTFLNQAPTHGAHPTYAEIDKTGKYVVVANYFGGTIEVFPLKKEGRLDETWSVARDTGTGANPKRQDGPHRHAVILSPGNRFAIAADLGIDKLVVYRFDATKGSLTPNDPPYAKEW
jgi:6-phosphogluconolactonase